MNVTGPNQVHCGMPPFKVIQSENVLFILTLCLRPLRKENINLTRQWGTSREICFFLKQDCMIHVIKGFDVIDKQYSGRISFIQSTRQH